MEYLSYTDTRSQLREVLDTAEAGLPIGIQRPRKAGRPHRERKTARSPVGFPAAAPARSGR